MQSLDYIKKRIRSVKTTSKITGAMKLIATASIRKQAKLYDKISSFCRDFYHVISPLVETSEENDTQQKSTLYILISSSMGLCGAFNINVTKSLISQLTTNDKIIVIGKKGAAYLKSRGYQKQIMYSIEVSDKDVSYLEILPTTEVIMDEFKKGQFSHVKMVYTKFINSMTFTPTTIQILPFDKTLFQNQNTDNKYITQYAYLNAKDQQIEYESSKSTIFKSIFSTFMTTLIYAGIIESSLCESGSRRNAMDTATKNAKELIDNLTLQFNRARQEKITQEITEIVAGGAANE